MSRIRFYPYFLKSQFQVPRMQKLQFHSCFIKVPHDIIQAVMMVLYLLRGPLHLTIPWTSPTNGFSVSYGKNG